MQFFRINVSKFSTCSCRRHLKNNFPITQQHGRKMFTVQCLSASDSLIGCTFFKPRVRLMSQKRWTAVYFHANRDMTYMFFTTHVLGYILNTFICLSVLREDSVIQLNKNSSLCSIVTKYLSTQYWYHNISRNTFW